MPPQRVKLGKRGANGAGPTHEPASARDRMLGAMIAAVAEKGYSAVREQDVILISKVPASTFNEHFVDKEDCFLDAFDAAAARLTDRVGDAARDGADWRSRIRAGLVEVLSFVAEEPEAARVLIVESRGATRRSLEHRDALLDRCAACVEVTVGEEVDGPAAASGLTPAGVVGGIEALLYSRLAENDVDDLASLLPSLMYLAVLPYLGHEAAGQELA